MAKIFSIIIEEKKKVEEMAQVSFIEKLLEIDLIFVFFLVDLVKDGDVIQVAIESNVLLLYQNEIN